jgi:uncharacterized LabA/DUF88 family protein
MVFIDSQNLTSQFWEYQKQNNVQGRRIDFQKMADLLAGDRKLKRIYYYGSIPQYNNEDERDHVDRQHRFHRSLGYRGFTTCIIPLKERTFETTCPKCGHHFHETRPHEKGVDVALVSDFISLGIKGAYDVAVIVSGDFDFHKAIELIQREGCIVEVASFRYHGTSNEMRRIADRYIDLGQLLEEENFIRE